MSTRRLEGKRALVTGASAGIGAATARALAAEGAELVLCARRAERLDALAAELGGAQTVALDVRDAAAMKSAFEGETFDIVLANAGLGRGLGKIGDGDPADWAEMMDTNVGGVLHTVHATLPAMLARGAGDFVVLGSVAGREVYPGGNVYCASKHAVRGVYKALRRDHYGSGVRFTTVDPGMVETEFSLVRFHGDAEAADAMYKGMTPMRPEDVAESVLFAVTRPPHVNIGEIVMWASAQGATWLCARDEG
ncbi:MAG: SDR family NAD(P)-dependent oxidoreductase [Planctomycetota bacterium]